MDKRTTGNALVVGGALLGLFALGKALGLIKPDPDPRLPGDIEVDHETEKPTLTNEAAQVKADQVYAAIYGDGSFWTGQGGEDEDAVISALTDGVNVTTDVLLIADKYGRRSGSFATTGDLDLFGVVAEYLSPSDRLAINEDYRSKGITTRFT
jgi:hypothetical protein